MNYLPKGHAADNVGKSHGACQSHPGLSLRWSRSWDRLFHQEFTSDMFENNYELWLNPTLNLHEWYQCWLVLENVNLMYNLSGPIPIFPRGRWLKCRREFLCWGIWDRSLERLICRIGSFSVASTSMSEFLKCLIDSLSVLVLHLLYLSIKLTMIAVTSRREIAT